ncbi:hypothetical protein G9F32_00395 [Acinetobacter sp. 194]|nr:hypothetical protein [Acinetobacter shaoyimingii]NHB56496.1 hypothetical protein [Acinetobacter shaoyimingii]
MRTLQQHKMKVIAFAITILSFCGVSLLTYCSLHENDTDQNSAHPTERADILPYLDIKEIKPNYALPFCEKKNCIEIDIQSLNTQEGWVNQWIADSQSRVIQDQIGLKQVMTLQQAIDAYVRKSDLWQEKLTQYLPYELHMQTRIAAQRNQYVLLQIIVNSKQEEVIVKDRGYFFVADRKTQKKVSILDVINPKQQNELNRIVQEHYSQWLAQQSAEVKKTAPKKLYWGQNDWFFDNEGLGIHYRASEITEKGTQLDIYLTKAQTQKILKPEVYQKMF